MERLMDIQKENLIKYLKRNYNMNKINNYPEICDHDWEVDTEFSTREMHSFNSGSNIIIERKIYYCKKCDTYKKVTKVYDVHEDTEL